MDGHHQGGIMKLRTHDPNNVDTLALYDLDIIPLPTITSNEFEIAINRSLFS